MWSFLVNKQNTFSVTLQYKTQTNVLNLFPSSKHLQSRFKKKKNSKYSIVYIQVYLLFFLIAAFLGVSLAGLCIARAESMCALMQVHEINQITAPQRY